MTTPEAWANQVGPLVQSLFADAIKQAFSDGFMSGATAYAGLRGDVCLMKNESQASFPDPAVAE
jgi:hypothetical protein